MARQKSFGKLPVVSVKAYSVQLLIPTCLAEPTVLIAIRGNPDVLAVAIVVAPD
jgi:hypothetical protein